MRIVYYPVIDSEARLSDLYHRACWYLPDMDGQTVVFPVHREGMRPGELPRAMGPCPPPQFQPEFPWVQHLPEAERLLQGADFILLWRDELTGIERYFLQGLSKRLLNVAAASPTSRHEAYHNAIVRHELMPYEERLALIEENRQRFLRLAPALRTERAYIFGTGPSLAEAYSRDFPEGIRIICNTIVRNERLLAHVRPQIIVAADPALHFGVSRYAFRFRQCLVGAMKEYGALLFLPLGYYPLFIRHYAELKDRTIGVPIVPARPENVSLDWTQRFEIACYANILTLFLLPLATTLAEEVHVLGCDGRKPEGVPTENASPFWAHHSESEFEDIYETLRICHPSFFHLDFQDWYQEHCEAVELLVGQAEALGKTIVTATTSYIPCLMERLPPELKNECQQIVERARQEAPLPEFEYCRDTRTRREYRVSVFVSMYNAERFVVPMLENLVAQTLYSRGEMEIILIDSASPQGEQAVLAPYLDRQEHLFYGRTAQRETVYGAFNRGLRQARGKYVMNLDTDNRLRNDAVEIFADYLDSHADIGLVYGNQYIGQFENETFYNHVRFGFCQRPLYSPDMMLHKYYFGSELMWRRELHDKVGYYDESYIVAGDYEMVCRLATVTKFAHVDRYFGLYLKNLQGVEYTNLELCNREDQRIRDQYRDHFPPAVDPHRVHIHYPLRPGIPRDYMTIVCVTSSYDQSITPSIQKLKEFLNYPHIIYCIDQNSAEITKDSIAFLIGEGLVSAEHNLLPRARHLFALPIAYAPTLQFYVLAHGQAAHVAQNFMPMNRPRLTEYFRSLHEKLTQPFRGDSGHLDPLKVPFCCDHHEIERLEVQAHLEISWQGAPSPPIEADLVVLIQHYAPEGQTSLYREALKQNIAAIRSQEYPGKVAIVVTDDGSAWSQSLGADDDAPGIRVYGGAVLRENPILQDLAVDLYLYKPRSGYFGKALLWNAALQLTRSPSVVCMDDDHYFLRRTALALYDRYLQQYELVIGNTRTYNFRDSQGVVNHLSLDFASSVVQGSNFGVRRALLEAWGGFELRTFFWGTGDDPAFFWKAYQRLRPTTVRSDKRACYVDDIVTENLHSGRWREHCRVDLDLFIRDFLRLYGVHPNSNPSRDRSTWVDHIQGEAVMEPAAWTPRAAAPDPEISVVVPWTGEKGEDLWNTVVSILQQTAEAPFEVIVAKSREGGEIDCRDLPTGVNIVTATETGKETAYWAGIDAARGKFAGWMAPGMIMVPKALHGAITCLREGRGELVYGSAIQVNETGLTVKLHRPPDLCRENALIWAGKWIPGAPIFGEISYLRNLAGPLTSSPPEEADLLIRSAQQNRITAKGQIFALFAGERTADFTKLAPLLRQFMGDRFETALVENWKNLHFSSNGAQPAPEEVLSYIPWFMARQRKNFVIRGLFRRLREAGIAKVALWGDGDHTRQLLTGYWPRDISLEAVFTDQPAGEEICGIKVMAWEAVRNLSLQEVDAWVVSSQHYEEKYYRRAKELISLPVYTIYGAYQ